MTEFLLLRLPLVLYLPLLVCLIAMVRTVLTSNDSQVNYVLYLKI